MSIPVLVQHVVFNNALSGTQLQETGLTFVVGNWVLVGIECTNDTIQQATSVDIGGQAASLISRYTGNGFQIEVWGRLMTGTPGTTATITFAESIGTNYAACSLDEISAPLGVVPDVAFVGSTGLASTTATSATITPAAGSGNALFAYCYGGAVNAVSAPTGGFTLLSHATAFGGAGGSAYLLTASASGTYAVSFTLGTTANWVVGILSFKENSAAVLFRPYLV